MSDKVNSVSLQAERFFTRLIMKVDDFGCFFADPRVLKANLFPLLLDTVREADLLRWLAECQKAGLIVLYEHAGKKYVQILDFRQRLDKARNKYPLPSSTDFPEVVNGFPAEVGSRTGKEVEEPNGLGGASAPPIDPILVFKGIEKKKKPLYDFIAAYKPQFVQPYADLWNLFAAQRGKPLISKISDARQRKFKTRINEKGFDFLKILIKAGAAGDFLSTSKWFTWDWIMDSEANYLKVLEGNYDKEKAGGQKGGEIAKPSLTKHQIDLNSLFERFLADDITVISVDPADYNLLKTSGLLAFGEKETESIRHQALNYMTVNKIEHSQEKELSFKKKFGVLEYFEQQKAKGQAAIFYLVNPEHEHSGRPQTV